MKFSKKPVIAFVLLLALLFSLNIGYAGKPAASVKYLNWLGSHTDHPTSPASYSVYYNSTSGSSYIWEGSGWQIFAAKGDTGQQGPEGPVGPQGAKGDPGEPGISSAAITEIQSQLATLTSQVSSMQGEINVLEAENARLKGILGLDVVSSTRSSINQYSITAYSGEPFQFTVYVYDRLGNTLSNLSISDFTVSFASITQVTKTSAGTYDVQATIADPGTYALRLSVKGVQLASSLTATVLDSTDVDGTPSAIESSITHNIPTDTKIGIHYLITATILDDSRELITNLEPSDFSITMTNYQSFVTLSPVHAGSGVYNVDIEFKQAGDYNFQLKVNGTALTTIIQTRASY